MKSSCVARRRTSYSARASQDKQRDAGAQPHLRAVSLGGKQYRHQAHPGRMAASLEWRLAFLVCRPGAARAVAMDQLAGGQDRSDPRNQAATLVAGRTEPGGLYRLVQLGVALHGGF